MRHEAIKLNLVQGTPEWHKWRSKIITASRIPAIMGESRFSTPYKVWEEFQGLADEKEQTPAMKRGNDLEPHVLKLVEQQLGVELVTGCFQHPILSYLGCSMDGISRDLKIGVEIKCGNLKDHELAKSGVMPLTYKGQKQCTLEVMGWDSMIFAHYYEHAGQNILEGRPGELVLNHVFRDFEYIATMLERVKEFWKMVQDFKPPERNNRDFILNDSAEWHHKAKEYKTIDQMIRDLENKKEAVRSDLLVMTQGMSTLGGGIRVSKILEKGRVDYNAIPELKGLDLDRYRKEPITKWRIS